MLLIIDTVFCSVLDDDDAIIRIDNCRTTMTTTVVHWVEIVLRTAGDFLLELLQSLTGTKKLFDLFNFVINVMKYNAVYLKEDAVSGIIRYM